MASLDNCVGCDNALVLMCQLVRLLMEGRRERGVVCVSRAHYSHATVQHYDIFNMPCTGRSLVNRVIGYLGASSA